MEIKTSCDKGSLHGLHYTGVVWSLGILKFAALLFCALIIVVTRPCSFLYKMIQLSKAGKNPDSHSQSVVKENTRQLYKHKRSLIALEVKEKV